MRKSTGHALKRWASILQPLRARVELGQPFVLVFDGDRGAWLGPVEADPAFARFVEALREGFERATKRD